VSLGGDIAIAGPLPEGGWPIRVTDDHRSDGTAPGQTIALSSGGLATSSTTVRRWRAGGAERHHILDPVTGTACTEVWRTVSVAGRKLRRSEPSRARRRSFVGVTRSAGWRDAGCRPRLVTTRREVFRAASWPEEQANYESLYVLPRAVWY